MREWFGKIAGVLCVMTVMLHLIPEGSFSKYVRFYASLLYLLVAAGPVIRFFTKEDVLERFLKLELIKEEQYELGTAVEGLQDLKNESFQSVWKQEIVRQFGEIASAYGAEMTDASLVVGEDWTLQEAELQLLDGQDGTAEKISEEIASIYGLKPDQIRVVGREGG
jgi:hypothetical protein